MWFANMGCVEMHPFHSKAGNLENPTYAIFDFDPGRQTFGSARIKKFIEQGGIELIRVTDNGSGIPQDQLPLAVTSHATSKIRSAEDLFRIGTLGFRGEALASIAEISQFRLASRAVDATAGTELEVNVAAPAGQRRPA